MSSSDARWAELASQNERVIQAGEPGCCSTDHAGTSARTQWAELASQSERLVGRRRSAVPAGQLRPRAARACAWSLAPHSGCRGAPEDRRPSARRGSRSCTCLTTWSTGTRSRSPLARLTTSTMPVGEVAAARR